MSGVSRARSESEWSESSPEERDEPFLETLADFSDFCEKDLRFFRRLAMLAVRSVSWRARRRGCASIVILTKKPNLFFVCNAIFGGRYDRYDCYSRPISTVLGWSEAD